MSQKPWRISCRDSALKHGFDRMDAISAVVGWRLRAIPMEPTRVDGNPDPAGFIGPAVDGTELEVFANLYPVRREIAVFHMMPARPKIIQKIRNAKANQERKQP